MLLAGVLDHLVALLLVALLLDKLHVGRAPGGGLLLALLLRHVLGHLLALPLEPAPALLLYLGPVLGHVDRLTLGVVHRLALLPRPGLVARGLAAGGELSAGPGECAMARTPP